MTQKAPHTLFDRTRVARNRDRASSCFETYDFFIRRESNQLLERLEDVSREFPLALDLGSHCGMTATALNDSEKIGFVAALERSKKMAAVARNADISVVNGDEEALPFRPGIFDLVTSILSMHWLNDLPGAMIQLRQALKPDGLFLGCLFGGATLSELRTSLIAAESELYGGVSPRISPMPGLQDMAGLLQRAGFALPVADIERVTVRYDHPLKLLQDLKGMGEQAAFVRQEGQTSRRPLSRRLITRMSEVYQDQFSDPDGRIRATFEIIWLSGWAPSASQPQPLKPGSAKASLADAVKKTRE
ncbi:MAG: methyltransferase domain-containing protein [Pseudomonadota bacterium]